VTVFLTTQYLEEADQLADRIVVLDAGRVVADGTAAQLKQRYADQRLDLTLADEATFAELTGALGDEIVHSDPSHARASGSPPTAPPPTSAPCWTGSTPPAAR
jgi:ABC-2 type transport system ATP-binding protein